MRRAIVRKAVPFFLFNNNPQTIYSLLGSRDVLEVEVK
jgi:hypothetical protein